MNYKCTLKTPGFRKAPALIHTLLCLVFMQSCSDSSLKDVLLPDSPQMAKCSILNSFEVNPEGLPGKVLGATSWKQGTEFNFYLSEMKSESEIVTLDDWKVLQKGGFFNDYVFTNMNDTSSRITLFRIQSSTHRTPSGKIPFSVIDWWGVHASGLCNLT